MNQYVTNTTFDEVARLAAAAKRVLLLTHGKPDGDAMGSMLALYRALARSGRQIEMFLKGPLGWNLRPFVAAGERINLLEESQPSGEYDLIFITDTGARAQLDPIADWIAARRDKVIVIDHHINGNVELADRRIVDAKAPSATFLVAGLLDAMKVALSGSAGGGGGGGVAGTSPDREGAVSGGRPFSIAEALLLGLATDTGWFKFNNASPAAFRLAARLIEAGADKNRIFAITEENDRPQRLALKARAIASIEYVAGGGAAVMTLLPKDFQETGADSEEMTGIVNEPLSIAKVRVSALISTMDGRTTKISWRSKPPSPSGRGAGGEGVSIGSAGVPPAPDSPSLSEGGGQGVGEGAQRHQGTKARRHEASPFTTNHEPQATNEPILPAIDVNLLAKPFGGGGHIHAAGARVDRALPEVRREVILGLEQAT